MCDDLTCPDDKLGHISVGSQDLANRNQDDTYHVVCRSALTGTFTQTDVLLCLHFLQPFVRTIQKIFAVYMYIRRTHEISRLVFAFKVL